jgi:hypothetical protein
MKCVATSGQCAVVRLPFSLSDRLIARFMTELDALDPEARDSYSEYQLRETICALVYRALTGQVGVALAQDDASATLVRDVCKRWSDRGVLRKLSACIGIQLRDA